MEIQINPDIPHSISQFNKGNTEHSHLSIQPSNQLPKPNAPSFLNNSTNYQSELASKSSKKRKSSNSNGSTSGKGLSLSKSQKTEVGSSKSSAMPAPFSRNMSNTSSSNRSDSITAFKTNPNPAVPPSFTLSPTNHGLQQLPYSTSMPPSNYTGGFVNGVPQLMTPSNQHGLANMFLIIGQNPSNVQYMIPTGAVYSQIMMEPQQQQQPQQPAPPPPMQKQQPLHIPLVTPSHPLGATGEKKGASQQSTTSTSASNNAVYNNRGYEICGALNKFNKPCQRIGKNCPFHPQKPPTAGGLALASSPSPSPPASSPLPSSPSHSSPKPEKKSVQVATNPNMKKKVPFKRGWSKEEHARFLKGLQKHGKGCWKEIAKIVETRSPAQIQIHADRYFRRQKKTSRNKKSIHDITLEDILEEEAQSAAAAAAATAAATGLSSASPIPVSPHTSSSSVTTAAPVMTSSLSSSTSSLASAVQSNIMKSISANVTATNTNNNSHNSHSHNNNTKTIPTTTNNTTRNNPITILPNNNTTTSQVTSLIRSASPSVSQFPNVTPNTATTTTTAIHNNKTKTPSTHSKGRQSQNVTATNNSHNIKVSQQSGQKQRSNGKSTTSLMISPHPENNGTTYITAPQGAPSYPHYSTVVGYSTPNGIFPTYAYTTSPYVPQYTPNHPHQHPSNTMWLHNYQYHSHPTMSPSAPSFIPNGNPNGLGVDNGSNGDNISHYILSAPQQQQQVAVNSTGESVTPVTDKCHDVNDNAGHSDTVTYHDDNSEDIKYLHFHDHTRSHTDSQNSENGHSFDTYDESQYQYPDIDSEHLLQHEDTQNEALLQENSEKDRQQVSDQALNQIGNEDDATHDDHRHLGDEEAALFFPQENHEEHSKEVQDALSTLQELHAAEQNVHLEHLDEDATHEPSSSNVNRHHSQFDNENGHEERSHFDFESSISHETNGESESVNDSFQEVEALFAVKEDELHDGVQRLEDTLFKSNPIMM